MITCSQCTTSFDSKFCPECGASAQLKRINKHYVSHEIFHLLHFEKGYFYNLKELFTRPGDSIKQFLESSRAKHMKPIPYLIVNSLLYTLVTRLVKVDNERHFDSSKNTSALFDWVNSHYGYANILMGIVTAFFVYLVFKKYKYNFFEIVVVLCFVLGQGMLLLALVSCFHTVLHPLVYGLLISFIVFIYASWAMGQFFDKYKVSSYLKAVLAYFLGYLFFYLIIVAIGLSLDWITTGKIGG